MKLKIDISKFLFKRTGFYEIISGDIKWKSSGINMWDNELTVYKR